MLELANDVVAANLQRGRQLVGIELKRAVENQKLSYALGIADFLHYRVDSLREELVETGSPQKAVRRRLERGT